MSDNKHLDDACTLIDALEQYVGKSHDDLAGMTPAERGELAASAITESYAVLYAHRYDGIWPETRVYAEGESSRDRPSPRNHWRGSPSLEY